MGLIVLDTTILLYAVGEDHPLREPCRALADALGNGFDATTTVEVIQEFAHVRSRRRANAAELARTYAQLLAPLLSPTADDLADGLDLFEAVTELGSFDCVLAASCVRRSARLVSADGAFGSVPGLDHLDPGSPEFADLLA